MALSKTRLKPSPQTLMSEPVVVDFEPPGHELRLGGRLDALDRERQLRPGDFMSGCAQMVSAAQLE
jgi:hypothetical protein